MNPYTYILNGFYPPVTYDYVNHLATTHSLNEPIGNHHLIEHIVYNMHNITESYKFISHIIESNIILLNSSIASSLINHILLHYIDIIETPTLHNDHTIYIYDKLQTIDDMPIQIKPHQFVNLLIKFAFIPSINIYRIIDTADHVLFNQLSLINIPNLSSYISKRTNMYSHIIKDTTSSVRIHYDISSLYAKMRIT